MVRSLFKIYEEQLVSARGKVLVETCGKSPVLATHVEMGKKGETYE